MASLGRLAERRHYNECTRARNTEVEQRLSMREIKILWAEDDASQFTECSKSLTVFFQSRGSTPRIVHVVDGDAIYRLLMEERFDLLIADIVMEHWGGIPAVSQLSELYPGLPKIIISTHTEDPNLETVLNRLVEEGRLRSFHSVEPRSAWCEAAWSATLNRPPTILHLSDIHFGRFHGIPPELTIEDLIQPVIADIQKAQPVDLIVVSGDLSSEGLDKEFVRSEKFLVQIAEVLGIGSERVVIVPGNHDILRSLPKEQRFDPFVRFVSRFCSAPGVPGSARNRYVELFDARRGLWNNIGYSSDSLFCVSVFDELRTIVIGFNSVIADENHWNEAQISTAQLMRVSSTLKSLRQPQSDYLRVAVFHHHLVESPSFRKEGEPGRLIRNQGFLLNHLISNGIKLILHGHTHYCTGYKYVPYVIDNEAPPNSPVHVFGTGTLSGSERDPAQSFFHFSLIRLEENREGKIAAASVVPYRLMDSSLDWRSMPTIRLQW
jgi:3',5'-cyclic AMP phosphodiesterase CpdA/CheY-like chemotaxis protein